MLVKIIQKSGIDVEELIDKWNNEVELENNNNNNNLTDN
jgi:arsenate reductase-like glutaredoxin family protein